MGSLLGSTAFLIMSFGVCCTIPEAPPVEEASIPIKNVVGYSQKQSWCYWTVGIFYLADHYCSMKCWARVEKQLSFFLSRAWKALFSTLRRVSFIVSSRLISSCEISEQNMSCTQPHCLNIISVERQLRTITITFLVLDAFCLTSILPGELLD